MAEHSTIEWTDATWNPVTGCSVVSPGCANCYAMKLAGTRLKHHSSREGLTIDTKAGPVWNGNVRLNEPWLDQPLRWKRPRMIFVCAHGDLFHEDVPDEWIDKVFAVMALAPQHTFQVLTKRSGRMLRYFETSGIELRYRWAQSLTPGSMPITQHAVEAWLSPSASSHQRALYHAKLVSFPLPNVWLGVSAEDQTRADERIPDLLEAPAAIRFVSAEPLIGPIELRDINDGRDSLHRRHGSRLDWVIVGGESGNGARPTHPDWVRAIRDECAAAEVPFFFKQWGNWISVYDRDRDDPDWRSIPKAGDWSRKRWLNLAGGQGFHGDALNMMRNVGKKTAGRLLDGIEHNGMPVPREVPFS